MATQKSKRFSAGALKPLDSSLRTMTTRKNSCYEMTDPTCLSVVVLSLEVASTSLVGSSYQRHSSESDDRDDRMRFCGCDFLDRIPQYCSRVHQNVMFVHSLLDPGANLRSDRSLHKSHRPCVLGWPGVILPSRGSSSE